jgi:hypothetical protein
VALRGACGLVIEFTTGNVVRDFPQGPGVYLASDPTNDLYFTHDDANHGSGWNLFDVRFAYDAASDTAYFGEGLLVLFWRVVKNGLRLRCAVLTVLGAGQ